MRPHSKDIRDLIAGIFGSLALGAAVALIVSIIAAPLVAASKPATIVITQGHSL